MDFFAYLLMEQFRLILGMILGFVLGYWLRARRRPEVKSIVSNRERGECKMVLIIRMDLQMGKGKVAAQCSHATLAAYQKAEKQCPEWIEDWEEWGTAKITLKCPDEDQMLLLQKSARKLGLVAVSIQDAGRTQIAAGSRTVLAIGPGPKALIDNVTGNLKLY